MPSRPDPATVRAYAEDVARCCHLWPISGAAIDEVEAILWRVINSPPLVKLARDIGARCHAHYLNSRPRSGGAFPLLERTRNDD